MDKCRAGGGSEILHPAAHGSEKIKSIKVAELEALRYVSATNMKIILENQKIIGTCLNQ